uniref:coxsackievirus and adenovirus receptor homolog n=1 Tax=Maylandia zebra TaxID=106582 RepID=UPI000D308FCA|nr:coxsackievirus and adenovirus receptor homolog [Maylandia zebra]
MFPVTASLCSTLLFVGVFVFVSAEQKIITAEPEQKSVTLPCRAPNNSSSISVVEWRRADLGDEYVLLYRDDLFDPTNQDPSFKNRVDLQDRQMKDGDASLILKDVTITDNGTYVCQVFMGGTNVRKRANPRTDPISIIYLHVVPPGGSVGLIVGLSVAAVAVVLVAGFLVYRKCKRQNRDFN